MSKEVYKILVVEDDISEQKLLRMMARQSGYQIAFTFLNDGEEAMIYTKALEENTAAAEMPDLVLLDLNLPKTNGIEVLKSIKASSLLKGVPVIILTTSNNSSDLKAAYQGGASGYVRKPSVIEDYEGVIKQIFDYWFGTCLLL